MAKPEHMNKEVAGSVLAAIRPGSRFHAAAEAIVVRPLGEPFTSSEIADIIYADGRPPKAVPEKAVAMYISRLRDILHPRGYYIANVPGKRGYALTDMEPEHPWGV